MTMDSDHAALEAEIDRRIYERAQARKAEVSAHSEALAKAFKAGAEWAYDEVEVDRDVDDYGVEHHNKAWPWPYREADKHIGERAAQYAKENTP